MNKVRKRQVLLFGIALGALGATAGCGGGSSSAQLGANSRAEVYLESDNIKELDLIVAERQGPPDDPGACRSDSSNFGCTREFQPDSATIFFDTRSIASREPYYVYVRNLSGSNQRFFLQIRLDEEGKFTFGGEVIANEAFLVAKINRNTADSP